MTRVAVIKLNKTTQLYFIEMQKYIGITMEKYICILFMKGQNKTLYNLNIKSNPKYYQNKGNINTDK